MLRYSSAGMQLLIFLHLLACFDEAGRDRRVNVIGESAREIRATYYRQTAAAIRARAASSRFATVRVDLHRLAIDYERLADLVQSFPDTTEPLGDLWSSLKAAPRSCRDVARERNSVPKNPH
jgi:hypothetical protein